MELNSLQTLAVAEAMKKALDGATNPRGGAHGAPNLRTEQDDALLMAYEQDGTDRRRIIIGGVEVGTLSARISKAESGTRVAVRDAAALVRWLRESDDGLDALARLVAVASDDVIKAATADGVLPYGCAVEDYQKPAQWLGTTIRVKQEKVGEALGAELPSAVMGLLGGGENS